MEVQSTIPAKRGPEDDVQFVSVQPVKKARGSRESPPPQMQQIPYPSSAHPQAQNQEHQAHDTCLSNTGAVSGPQPEHSLASRGVSFPGLENYIFPPPPDSKPSRTSRSSPVLSPRQLPQPVLPNQIQDNLHAQQGFRGLVPPPQFQVPWGMSGLYPQAGPMNSNVPMSRPTPLLPAQPEYISTNPVMDIDDQPLSMSMALRKTESPMTPTHMAQMEPQRLPQCGEVPKTRVGSPLKPKEQAAAVQGPSNQGDHDRTKTLPYPSPQQEPQFQAHPPLHPQTRPPTPTATPPQAPSPAIVAAQNPTTVTRPHGLAAQQAPPPKGPCVICEQMRQQVLFNQANGLPIANLPQMAHGWHGLGPVPQMHMGHPNAGFSMVPNMLQTLQQRFQPISVGHLPMGYGMQPVPVQMQMQLQRQVLPPNVNGNESSSQGGPLQNQQVQQTQSLQAPGQVSQLAHGQAPQYVQSQIPSLPQSVLIQRPMIMNQQVLAPPPPSPSPQPSPQTAQTTQTPVVPEPKKHSPNLIVDIAETCEELFPWDEVAKRHGVTRVKVVETFGAVIQLPLLRCTTDKKRHGKLATNRLREYTKAKKDAEATNAAAATRLTPAVSTSSTSAAPVAQSQVAQVQANQTPTNQAQNQTRQVQTTQTEAMQAQAMQAQINQLPASQGHFHQNQPPHPGQAHASQGRNTISGVFEMANTISPLGLPSSLTNGLSGHWQQQ